MAPVPSFALDKLYEVKNYYSSLKHVLHLLNNLILIFQFVSSSSWLVVLRFFCLHPAPVLHIPKYKVIYCALMERVVGLSLLFIDKTCKS